MTENEAIKIIREYGGLFPKARGEHEALEMAINALEEVQKYRAIGTPEECRAAVEKQNADGCFNCAFETVEEWEMPFTKCKRNCKDYWRRRASDGKID